MLPIPSQERNILARSLRRPGVRVEAGHLLEEEVSVMETEVTKLGRTRRSRRELLARGAAGAIGVLTAQGVFGAKTAYAGSDGDVILGQDLQIESSTTGVQIVGKNTGDAFSAIVNEGTSSALYGQSNAGAGLFGWSDGGEGVFARSGGFTGTTPGTTRTGVHGVTDSSSDAAVWGENLGGGPGVLGGVNGSTGDGVEGQTDDAGHSGVYGHNESSTAGGKGVFGVSRNGVGVEGDGLATGVLGINTGGGNGVEGDTASSSASGVYGQNSGTGYGVAGRAAGGTGVLGDSANGTGVAASSQNAVALRVTGRAKFNRSGSVSITYPSKTASVSVPGGLTSSALVLALVQNAVTGVWVASAAPNSSTGKVTITLNKPPGSGSAPKTAKVAWFVLN
jgi:hypothetical protein